MADENINPKFTVDLRLLGRQVNETRMRVGHLDGSLNDVKRDIRVLLLMAQNHDEALKEMRDTIGELISRLDRRPAPTAEG